jgi:hypothetical protein
MKKSVKMLMAFVLLLGAGVALRFGQGAPPARTAPASPSSAFVQPNGAWRVGELRENGLRIIPSGRSNASAVLDPAQFSGQTRHAYWVATQIPSTLNQLYCWCECENSGMHRSNLQCFEDRMGESCDVCQGTAEIAYEMVKKGITDPGTIQAAVDAKWGRRS